ncbi:hypothetical protein [Sporosarcina cyprini]|uniref:hypothetical protein n=1 Tax=Sporosarcina cyprini TaxID=2910523 RepID=UPI001EE08366|nr:hypothetical protein [Sporosarcina cyprini]MCG3087702.1 hypothetical protein [Sporosarcina cyprini]
MANVLEGEQRYERFARIYEWLAGRYERLQKYMSGWLVIRAVGEWIREVVGKYERLAVIYERLPAVPNVGEIPGRSEAWLITGKKAHTSARWRHGS